jgi:hypothetical protein
MKMALFILGLLATSHLAQGFDFLEPPKYEKNKSYTIETKEGKIDKTTKPWQKNEPPKYKHTNTSSFDNSNQRDYSFSVKSK